MTAPQSPTVTTSQLLRTASTIAGRFEHKGQVISPTEAIERAAAAIESLAQIEALWNARVDWDVTQPAPAYDPALLAEVAA